MVKNVFIVGYCNNNKYILFNNIVTDQTLPNQQLLLLEDSIDCKCIFLLKIFKNN